MTLADTLYDEYDGTNMRSLAERHGLTLAATYHLLRLALIRDRLVRAVWEQCAHSIHLADLFAKWFLARPERWLSLPADRRHDVITQLSRAESSVSRLLDLAQSAAMPPACRATHPDGLDAITQVPPSANSTPAPWRHSVLIQALIDISGGDEDIQLTTGGAP